MTTTAAPPQSQPKRGSLEPYLYDHIEYYDHQVDGIRWLARQRNFLLADQMGLGKTLQALTVFAIDVKMNLGNTMVVICPVTLRANWAADIEKFTRFRYMLLGEEEHPKRPGVYRTLTPVQRKGQLLDFFSWKGPKILITNYDQVMAHEKELCFIKPRMLVVDESHNVRNPEAKKTLAIHGLIRHCERVALLTGTPVLNRVDELWSQLHMIDPNVWTNPDKFRNRYAVYGGHKGKTIVGAKNTVELNKILAEVMLRRLKKDHLNLPEPRIIQVPVDLHPVQRELYDQLENDLFLPDENGDPQEIKNALTKFLRLKQICGSSATVPGYADHSYKLDRAVEIILELMDNDEKVVVFTQFRDIHALLIARLQKAGVKYIPGLTGSTPPAQRVPIVNQWSAFPNAAPIVCMTQVAGVGLNMVAAKNALFVDKLFVPGLNDQAIDRTHRIGQSETQPVTVYELIARGTVEYRIEQILRGKNRLFDSVIEESTAFQKLLGLLKEAGGHR